MGLAPGLLVFGGETRHHQARSGSPQRDAALHLRGSRRISVVVGRSHASGSLPAASGGAYNARTR